MSMSQSMAFIRIFCRGRRPDSMEEASDILLPEVFMETDPVCQMPVEADMAEFKTEYRGKEYYFCSAGCYDQFTRDPKDFL